MSKNLEEALKPDNYRFIYDGLNSKLFVNEKHENKLKYTLRGITIVGIILSFLIPFPILSGTVAIILAGLTIFFERSIVEYTTLIAQPPPDFDLVLDEWCNNGFGIPQVPNVPIAFGPAYKSEEYAYKIWKYIGTWNGHLNTDPDNNINVSIILEEDGTYCTYLYSSPAKKSLHKMFETLEKHKGNPKYSQMKMYVSSIFWKILNITSTNQINTFLSKYNNGDEYLFAPFVLDEATGNMKVLHHLGIKKNHITIKKRSDLLETEPEYKLTKQLAKEWTTK